MISTKNLKHISKLNYEYNIINYIRHGYEKKWRKIYDIYMHKTNFCQQNVSNGHFHIG